MHIRLILLLILMFICAEKPAFAQNLPVSDKTVTYTDTLEDPTYFSSLDAINIGEYLGWVDDDTANQCGGYYLATPMLYTGTQTEENMPIEKMPLQITAESGEFYFKGKSTLSGNVVIMQPNKQIFADTAHVYRDNHGELNDINMLGNVRLQEPGKLLIADVATVPIKDEQVSHFSLYDVIYRITISDLKIQPIETPLSGTNNPPPVKESGLIAWGYAKKAEQTAPEQLDLRYASYSTCPPERKTCAWRLTSQHIHLNKTEGEGTAYHSVLWLENLPIMYLPYFNFPIDDRRKSGFLYPSVMTSTTSGFSYTQPYYFNLASNYDMIVSPTYFQERGEYVENYFRYLTSSSRGSFNIGVIPHDRKFEQFKTDAVSQYEPGDQLDALENDSETRGMFHWLDSTTFDKNWEGNIDYTYVSDDYFLEDIKQSDSSNNQLQQQGRVNYYGEYWSFEALLNNYQTLHPINQDPIYNQYARLPELKFNTDVPDDIPGVDYGGSAQFDYFYIAQNPDESTVPTTGYRYNLHPKTEFPIKKTYGYLIPGIEIDATTYQLSHPESGNPSDPSRVLPLFDIDSGLYFNRDTSVWGDSYTQTLEPRLYYLYVPYENQNNLPVFDSALYTLTYDQLFQNNRFSSVDRIGDANQLSYGATTRYIDQRNGMEKMNFSLGQILYFDDRKVSLCDTDECREQNTQPTSPVVAQTNYFFSTQWSLSGDTAYDADQQTFQNASVMIHYKKDARRVINLGYSYVGDGSLYTDQYDDDNSNLANLSQVHASYAWPVSVQWNTLGSIDWDTSYTNGVSFMLGAEYSTCCWGVSFMVNQKLTGVNNGENQFDRVYYVQFVLKGLGAANSRGSSSLIAQNIENYNNNFLSPF